MNQVVRVGLGSLIVKDERFVLMGLRLGGHGSNCWSLPGGHLEFGETPEECAIRETAEETGLVVSRVKRGPWTYDSFPDNGSHYVTLLMIADYEGGEPVVKEPHKCKEWRWFEIDQPPSPLFLSLQNLVRSGHSFLSMLKTAN